MHIFLIPFIPCSLHLTTMRSIPGQPRSDRAVAPSSADHVFQVRGQGGEVELTCDERGFVFKDTKKIGEGLYALLFLFF